jgi:hypothetical protein
MSRLFGAAHSYAQACEEETPSPGIDRHRKLFRGRNAHHHDGLTDSAFDSDAGRTELTYLDNERHSVSASNQLL